MAKRKSKEQKEAEQLAALRQRIDDIYIGSVGETWEEENGEPWPTEFTSFVQALAVAFRIRKNEESSEPGNEYLFELWNLHNYRNPESAAEFLFESGVRA